MPEIETKDEEFTPKLFSDDNQIEDEKNLNEPEGIYADQLERWFKYFPREQFLILKSEDLYSDPAKTYEQVLDFLGLTKFELNLFKAHRKGNYSSISVETRKKLIDYFRPHNERLHKLLGRDFGWNDE